MKFKSEDRFIYKTKHKVHNTNSTNLRVSYCHAAKNNSTNLLPIS